jgi:3' terminal RNA ribose 2'-O-methyltransferase Hen1
MIINITTTHYPATDLGYLLHKHPDRFQSVELSVGKAHIFYPEKSAERTTISLLLDIDPIDMVRGAKNLSGDGFSLGQYVNDRPYVASSFLSVALSKAFSSAMNGHCKDKPELVNEQLPFEVTIAAIPAPKGGEILIRKFFEPLGYAVELTRHQLDTKFPEWGDSKYYTLQLRHKVTARQLLSHLYVLIPALDNDKHYFVSESERSRCYPPFWRSARRNWNLLHPNRAELFYRRYHRKTIHWPGKSMPDQYRFLGQIQHRLGLLRRRTDALVGQSANPAERPVRLGGSGRQRCLAHC